MQYWHFYVFLCCGHSYHPERIAPKLDTYPVWIFSQGGYFQIRRSGGLDLIASLEANFEARSGHFHQTRRKAWEVLSPQDAKLGKSPHSGVISEIHRVKFGVIVINIFGGKIWGFNKNFRDNFWGQAPPPDLLIWKYPWGYSQSGCVNLNSKSKAV